ASDLNDAMRAADNDAIWCLRGGYGTMRILDRLDWKAFAARPRPLVGFSDNTALHLAALRSGVVSFHGPHPAAAEIPDFSAKELLRLLTDAKPAGLLPLPPGHTTHPETVVGGVAEGRLMGGNLALLAAMAGTPYALQAEGAILFIEDVGEPAYRIDRMLSQLLLSGALTGVKGVMVGAFNEPLGEAPGLPGATDVITERLGGLGFPLATGFPFGHIEESWTLPLGVRARLDADAGTLEITEAAVAARMAG
nr:LD-carboxypeptidase [Gemmatimonadota bacterium]